MVNAFQGFRRFSFLLFQFWEILIFALSLGFGLLGLWINTTIPIASFATALNMVIAGALVVVWCALLHAMGLYDSRRYVRRTNEALSLVGFATTITGFIALLGAFLGLPFNQPEFLAPFLVSAIALLVGGRLATRMILRVARSRGRNRRFVAVVGAGPHARTMIRKSILAPEAGVNLVGVFDDRANLASLPDDMPGGGSVDALKKRLLNEPIDEVIILLPLATSRSAVIDLVAYCRRVGVSARVSMHEFAVDSDRLSIEYVGDIPTIEYNNAPEWGWQGHVKHALDAVLATAGLIALSPLFLVVAALIKLDSPGPVFFRQTRVGKNRQPFSLYKFRTMRQDAEALQQNMEAQNEAEGPVFKIRNDPRVTRIGAFLRRYSIDELPQLINVVRGEMSLVGPRPLPMRDVERFTTDWHSRRFSVRPGLTCSWVLAGRSELSFERWVQMDVDYIDNWSLLKDARICLGTIPLVLRGSGAY